MIKTLKNTDCVTLFLLLLYGYRALQKYMVFDSNCVLFLLYSDYKQTQLVRD